MSPLAAPLANARPGKSAKPSTKFAYSIFSGSEAAQNLPRVETTARPSEKRRNWLLVENLDPEEVVSWLNLRSLCTFNLCCAEETNVLRTGLKLEGGEERPGRFFAPLGAIGRPVSGAGAPALPRSLLPFSPWVSSCCFLAMSALRSTLGFLHVCFIVCFFTFEKYFRSVLSIVLYCTEPGLLESSRGQVCYAAPSFLRVWFVPMPLL